MVMAFVPLEPNADRFPFLPETLGGVAKKIRPLRKTGLVLSSDANPRPEICLVSLSTQGLAII